MQETVVAQMIVHISNQDGEGDPSPQFLRVGLRRRPVECLRWRHETPIRRAACDEIAVRRPREREGSIEKPSVAAGHAASYSKAAVSRAPLRVDEMGVVSFDKVAIIATH